MSWWGRALTVGASLNTLRRTQASTAHTTGVKGSGVSGAGARNGSSRRVTMALKKLTTPTTGDTACVTGAAASNVLTVLAVRWALEERVCAAGAANVATDPTEAASDATISTAAIEVAVVDESANTDLAEAVTPDSGANESDRLVGAVG